MTTALTPEVQEKLDQINEILAGLPHCKRMGITVVNSKPGEAVMRLGYAPDFVGNPDTGVIHGAVVTSLMDTVGGLAAITGLADPAPVATLDLRIDYLKPAVPGAAIFGWAKVYRMTRHVAFVHGSAYQHDRDNPVASIAATYMVGSVGFAPGAKS